MLAYITSAMPRFDSYLDLYPTTQLRRALYAIHNDLIEFCLSSAEFLNRNLLGNPPMVSMKREKNDLTCICSKHTPSDMVRG